VRAMSSKEIILASRLIFNYGLISSPKYARYLGLPSPVFGCLGLKWPVFTQYEYFTITFIKSPEVVNRFPESLRTHRQIVLAAKCPRQGRFSL
jgi:hypothetical protein